MKALRSPWVTGVLVVIAVVVVVYQFWPQSLRALPAAHPPATMPPAAEARPVLALPAPATNAPTWPDRAIDLDYATAHMTEWTDSPRHDPFFLVPIVIEKPKQKTQYLSPVPKWKLKGIWRQTGGRVAAINNRVYADGDSVEGYPIERIEADQVWFRGPERFEWLGFERAGTAGPIPTNTPPITPSSRS